MVSVKVCVVPTEVITDQFVEPCLRKKPAPLKLVEGISVLSASSVEFHWLEKPIKRPRLLVLASWALMRAIRISGRLARNCQNLLVVVNHACELPAPVPVSSSVLAAEAALIAT